MMSPCLKKLWLPVLAGLALLSPASAEDRLLITGAGASFPQPLYVRWFEKYAGVDETVEFNYRGLGSAGGRKLVVAGEVDFGASDVPLADDAGLSVERVWHLPTVASAVAVCYNLEGVTDLKIDGPTLVAIFLGKITKWNDPAIQRQNPQAKLPDQAIVPVHLTEGGTLTDIFSQYLGAVSDEWRAKFPAKSTVAWPVGVSAYGNVGAARLLRDTPGGLGYLEWSAAKNHGVQIAALKNAAGHYLVPSVGSISAAIAATTIPDDFRFTVINPGGNDSYPVGILTWVLLDRQQVDAAKGRKLVAFLDWAYGHGESFAPSLGYAPLPPVLLDRVRARLGQLQF